MYEEGRARRLGKWQCRNIFGEMGCWQCCNEQKSNFSAILVLSVCLPTHLVSALNDRLLLANPTEINPKQKKTEENRRGRLSSKAVLSSWDSKRIALALVGALKDEPLPQNSTKPISGSVLFRTKNRVKIPLLPLPPPPPPSSSESTKTCAAAAFAAKTSLLSVATGIFEFE
ncbi:hypothetical protein VNO80_20602 [Phaseolus coccineus]|uniref:Uncharacterized protein n=1 Tax=Phaseolus coccineus TaxID=3886 RepID=A0AAN9M6C9_PHACN